MNVGQAENQEGAQIGRKEGATGYMQARVVTCIGVLKDGYDAFQVRERKVCSLEEKRASHVFLDLSHERSPKTIVSRAHQQGHEWLNRRMFRLPSTNLAQYEHV